MDVFPPQWELVPKWTPHGADQVALKQLVTSCHDPKAVERTLIRLSLIEIHGIFPLMLSLYFPL